MINFPELPFNFKSNNIIKHGIWYYSYVVDDKYSLCFKWDGMSASYNEVEIKLNFDLLSKD